MKRIAGLASVCLFVIFSLWFLSYLEIPVVKFRVLGGSYRWDVVYGVVYFEKVIWV